MATRGLVAGAAVAALVWSAPAFGQVLGPFFEVSNDLSPSQPSATVTLWVPVPSGMYAVASVAFDALAVGGPSVAWSDPELPVGFDPSGTTPGVVSPSGTMVAGALAGQIHLPSAGFHADTSNPVAVWRATISVDDFTPRPVSLATDIERYRAYVSEFSGVTEDRIIGDARAVVMVVPAPGAGVALALGLGLAGVRRRR